MNFGKQLREKRIEYGFTQQQVADHLQISRQSIIAKEQDKTEISLNEAVKFCELLTNYKPIDKKAELKNLLCEINTMIESGSIIVGALGLSENAVNFARKFYEEL